MLNYTSILLDIRFILIHLFLFRLQIYCKKRNKALVYVPKNLFHVPILFQSPQKSIFKTLYLQVLPEIAISVVVWIDNKVFPQARQKIFFPTWSIESALTSRKDSLAFLDE